MDMWMSLGAERKPRVKCNALWSWPANLPRPQGQMNLSLLYSEGINIDVEDGRDEKGVILESITH